MNVTPEPRGRRRVAKSLTAGALLALVTMFGFATAGTLFATETRANSAVDERNLKELRREAHRERQALRKERNQRLNDAVKSLRLEADDITAEYRERVRTIDTEFDLDRVRLDAETDSEIAALEGALQKELGVGMAAATETALLNHLSAMGERTRAHQDRVFEARKRGAGRVQAAQLEALSRKGRLLSERDDRVLARARELGLMTMPTPVLATPIGGELTRNEIQWNEREQRDVQRLHERHVGLLGEFSYGQKLRAWERANLEEDFALEWQELSELQDLQSQQRMLNPVMLQAGMADETSRQQSFARLAELGEQQNQIKIRYQHLRRERDIQRREEKRALTAVP